MLEVHYFEPRQSIVARVGLLAIGENVWVSLAADSDAAVWGVDRPVVEYGLFTMGDLELAARGIGHVAETGFLTQAGQALNQLEKIGATPALADRVASLLRGGVAERFSRGATVQRHAAILPPFVLLLTSSLEASYGGFALDLPAMASAAEDPMLGPSFQLLGLAALLIELDPKTPVRLDTEFRTKQKGPGFRSYARPKLPQLSELPDRVYALSKRSFEERPAAREAGPTGPELAQKLAVFLPGLSAELREKLERTQKSLTERTPRLLGPLADPELDAIRRGHSAHRRV
jgi:hypothetical protein